MKSEIMLRVALIDPPAGVHFAVQRGRDELLAAVHISADRISFEFPLTVLDADCQPARLTGPYVQGPSAARFVYICSGSRAGQVTSCWSRRIKVPLKGLTGELLKSLAGSDADLLEAEIAGRARDGGPACATVPLLRDWRRVTRSRVAVP